MNRRGGGELIRGQIDRIRSLMPESVIRTSLIVGFPGETDEEFEELYDFLAEYRLERVGVFAYSREEGTPAADMADQIDEAVKEARRSRLYELQTQIMDEHSEKLVGKTLLVLCCKPDENGMQCGRSYMDAPEIDGTVFFEGPLVPEGEFVNIKISKAEGCDLYGYAADADEDVVL